MAAPTVTAAQNPTGRMLNSGFKTIITFAYKPTVALTQLSVTPPGFDGGDPNVTASMHSNRWKTKHPRRLIDMSNAKAKVEYDPAVIADIEVMINKPDSVTIHFPDGAALAFWGFLKSFMPGEMSDENAPTADIEVVVSNLDPVACVEADPVFVAGPGTSPYC